MRPAVDQDYNEASRMIDFKLNMYFFGTAAPPFEVTRDNVLIDAEILEDVGLSDDSPLTNITVNTLSFSLWNMDAMFSPTNSASPFYNRILQGVVIDAFICTLGETEWINLGRFYLADWRVADNYARIDALCYDRTYLFVSDPEVPNLRVVEQNTLAYLQELMRELPFESQTLTPTPFLFPLETRRDSLNTLLNAKIFSSNCRRDGVIEIGRLPFTETYRVITDNDQIKDITLPQQFIMQYDDASIQYYRPELITGQSIFTMSDIRVLENYTIQDAVFSPSPVRYIESVNLNGRFHPEFVLNNASAIRFSGQIFNTGDDTIDFNMMGTIVDMPTFEIHGEGRCLKVENEFIQTALSAAAYRRYLSTYVRTKMQTIELNTRGNPLITLGSTIQVVSERYGLDFRGIVVINKMRYDGGLSAHLTLLNVLAIGGA